MTKCVQKIRIGIYQTVHVLFRLLVFTYTGVQQDFNTTVTWLVSLTNGAGTAYTSMKYWETAHLLFYMSLSERNKQKSS